MFAPRLCGFDKVVTDDQNREKLPCFVQNEDLEHGTDGRVVNNGTGAVKHIKQQCLNELRIFVHPLKIKALKICQRDRVFYVVEEMSILAALNPLMQAVGKMPGQGSGQGLQAADVWSKTYVSVA